MTKRVRPAKHWQRVNSPVRMLADHATPLVARDMKGALKHLGELLPPQAVALAKAGRWDDLKHHIQWGHYREVLKAPFGRLAEVWQIAGKIGARKITAAFHAAGKKVRYRRAHIVRKAVGDEFTFDILSPQTQERVRRAQDELIRDLEVDARDAIDAIVVAGVRAGLSPEEIVGDVRELIGLTDTQAMAVMNFRAMLEGLDPDALRRQLRNTTYDEQVRAAIDSGEALDGDIIDGMVGDYTDNYMDYRAATIAQTESTRAANQGLKDAYLQAVERGALPEGAVTVTWKVALDEKTCDICLSIPDRNPDGRPVNEPFDSIDGPQDAPPDPHPNCRCSLEFVTDLTQVDDVEEAFA